VMGVEPSFVSSALTIADTVRRRGSHR
jgi:hypothetical protein